MKKPYWVEFDRLKEEAVIIRMNKKNTQEQCRIDSHHCRDKHPDGKPRFVVGRLVLEDGK